MENDVEAENSDQLQEEDEQENNIDSTSHSNCVKNFDMRKLYTTLDQLDERYDEVRNNYHENMMNSNFDEDMFTEMVKRRGIAERNLFDAGGDESLIPAGFNLGGYCLVKLPKSILFIHRMKLRNNTVFKVNSVVSDFRKMVLNADLTLNDLHLFGTYTRAFLDKFPFVLQYTPNYGEVEFLLKNVKYNFEGRYRLLYDRLVLELIVSKLHMEDVLMTYDVQNKTTQAERIRRYLIEQFIERLKNDLDKWMQDYFNDYLMYHIATGDTEFMKYEEERTTILNSYTDQIIDALIKRIKQVNATDLRVPDYSIVAVNGMEFHLRKSSIRGLESIYRRSVGTGSYNDGSRRVDAIVAFSNLKVRCRYEAMLVNGAPPLAGELVFSADDLNALMSVLLFEDSEITDISLQFVEQTKSEILTVEGPANRMLSNWKPLLERHIIAIMSNHLIHYISLLGTLSKCDNVQLGRYDMENKEVGATSQRESQEKYHNAIYKRQNN